MHEAIALPRGPGALDVQRSVFGMPEDPLIESASGPPFCLASQGLGPSARTHVTLSFFWSRWSPAGKREPRPSLLIESQGQHERGVQSPNSSMS
jgi:hypothetical protein